MNRVYFATSDEEEGEPHNAGRSRPRLAVLVEMAAGQAAATLNRKRLGEAVKREELLRGFERTLPDGQTLRVQAFPIERPARTPAEPKPEPRTKLELMKAIEAGTSGLPGIPGAPKDAAQAKAAQDSKSELDALPLFSGGFEPYRVRAWLDGRELREVVGQAGREDARLALILLLLVGLGELVSGLRLYSSGFPTRFLVTAPVFLLGALGVWRHWKWSVNLALVVAIADTVIFAIRTVGQSSAQAFALSIIARALLISALWRLRRSGW